MRQVPAATFRPMLAKSFESCSGPGDAAFPRSECLHLNGPPAGQWMIDNMADTDDSPSSHELAEFLAQDQAEIAAEYERIFRRSTEDSGTAGDEGEENWAALLRSWLPDTYQVVPKGRILFPDRSASGQIDVLVLRPGYPPRLVNKKVYLSSGVLAAFECKNTLKASHVEKAAVNASFVKSKVAGYSGTLRGELRKPILFGILAHSHSWKGEASTPVDNVDKAVLAMCNAASHPSELLDIICVADLAAWTLINFIECPWFYPPDIRDLRLRRGVRSDGQVNTGYVRFIEGMFDPDAAIPNPNPVAVLIAEVLQQVAWQDENLKPLADYFRFTGLLGVGKAIGRIFGLNVFSEEVQQRLRHVAPTDGLGHLWDPWKMVT